MLKMMVRRVAFSAGLAWAGVGLWSTSALAEEVVVRIDNFAFVPEAVNARVGDTIVWENEDDIPHSVVSSQSPVLRSRAMDTGQRYVFAVRDAGAFEYFCGLHPHMKGKVVVQN